MLSLILTLAALSVVTFIVARVGAIYVQTTGTFKERLLATGNGSAVILKEYATIIGAGALLLTDKAFEVVSMPEVQAFVREHTTPEVVGYFIMGTSLLGIAARLRTLFAK